MPIRCIICFEVVSTQVAQLATLKCGHVFHEKCLLEWLKTSSTCPKCRADVVDVSKNLIHLFMDTDCGDASGVSNEFRSTAAMNGKLTEELRRQEELTNFESVKCVAATNQVREIRAALATQQEANIKLSADLEKKKLKLETDAAMKRQLREENKELRKAVRISKSEASKMKAEIMAARRNIVRMEVGFQNIRKELVGFINTKFEKELEMNIGKKRTSIAEAAARDTPKRKNSTAEEASDQPKTRVTKRKT